MKINAHCLSPRSGRMPAAMLWLAACLLALALGPEARAASQTLNCDGRIVRLHDPIWRVARRCPEPFWTERWQQALAYDPYGYPLRYGSDTIEVWYLNFGSRRLMRKLVFRNGSLEQIRALDYGVDYFPGSRRCTARELEHAGTTAGEIYARCGEPDFRYDFSGLHPYYGGPWPPPAGSSRERWAYDFGPGRFVRELFFVDGRLVYARAQER